MLIAHVIPVSIELEQEFHRLVKQHCSEQDITMKKWIRQAMENQLRLDQHYGWN